MRKSRFDLPRPIAVIVLASLGLALILAFDLMPFLRGGEAFNWQWPYQPVPLARAILLVLGIGVYVGGAWMLLHRSHRPAIFLLWCMLGAAALALAVIYLRFDDPFYQLFARTVSGVTTGPHLAAAEIDWAGTAWHNWPAVMESYFGRSGHVFLSPPGLPMWYGLLNAVFGALPGLAEAMQRALLPAQCHNYDLLKYSPAEWASAWFGILMPVWAALSILPLYAIARRLCGNVARLIVAWWPLIPALVMFAPSWNTLYPLLALTAFYLLLVGLERGGGWLLMSGLLTGLLTFANFSVIPLAGLFGFYVLLRYWKSTHPLPTLIAGLPTPENTGTRAWTQPVIAGLWFGAGAVLPWLAYWLVTRGTPFDMLRQAMSAHLDLDRPYLPWLWFHSWEWALFTGLPFILLWLAAAWTRVRRWRERGPVLAVSLALTMLALVLSGTARGETGRVWLFFAPFVLLAVGERWSGQADFASVGTDHGFSLRSWLAVTFAQAALLMALAATWPVIDAPDIQPRPSSPGALADAAAKPVGADFGGLFRLVNWDASVEDNTVVLKLNWEGLTQLTIPYWFGALLVYPDGRSVPQAVVWQPLETRYPTTCWSPGEYIGDTIRLPLPPDASAGDWWISLTSFADDAGTQFLPVTLPDGKVDQQVGLGPVDVP